MIYRLKSIKEQGNAAGGLVDGDEYTEMLGIFPTLDVLENAIADDEARLSSMSEVDQQVLREYEERKRNIEVNTICGRLCMCFVTCGRVCMCFVKLQNYFRI